MPGPSRWHGTIGSSSIPRSSTCPRSSTTLAWFLRTTSAAATRSTARIAADRLAGDAGEPEARARAIYDVIALHNLETLPPDPASEVVLLWDSLGTDVTGHRFADIRPAIIPGLLAAYPRVDFKREFTALLVDQASRKPTCPAAEMVATGMLEEIAQAPFDS